MSLLVYVAIIGFVQVYGFLPGVNADERSKAQGGQLSLYVDKGAAKKHYKTIINRELWWVLARHSKPV